MAESERVPAERVSEALVRVTQGIRQVVVDLALTDREQAQLRRMLGQYLRLARKVGLTRMRVE